MSDNTFLQDVKIALIKRQMSLSDLYVKLGINYTYNYFYQVVNGQRNSPEMIEKVARELGIECPQV